MFPAAAKLYERDALIRPPVDSPRTKVYFAAAHCIIVQERTTYTNFSSVSSHCLSMYQRGQYIKMLLHARLSLIWLQQPVQRSHVFAAAAARQVQWLLKAAAIHQRKWGFIHHVHFTSASMYNATQTASLHKFVGMMPTGRATPVLTRPSQIHHAFCTSEFLIY
jgi:hypothetical protein